MGLIHKTKKNIANKLFFPAMVAVGAEKLISKRAGKDFLILAYHGVMEGEANPFNGRHLSSVAFEKQLQYFKKNFNVVSLQEIFKMSASQQKHFRFSVVKKIQHSSHDVYHNFVS